MIKLAEIYMFQPLSFAFDLGKEKKTKKNKIIIAQKTF